MAAPWLHSACSPQRGESQRPCGTGWHDTFATMLGQGNDLMIEALAMYSNLRRFTVTTSEPIEYRWEQLTA